MSRLARSFMSPAITTVWKSRMLTNHRVGEPCFGFKFCSVSISVLKDVCSVEFNPAVTYILTNSVDLH